MTNFQSAITTLSQSMIFRKALIVVFIPLVVNCTWLFVLSSTLSMSEELAKREHQQSVLVDELNGLLTVFFTSLSDAYSFAVTGRQRYRDAAWTGLTQLRAKTAGINKILSSLPNSKDLGSHFDQLIEQTLLELNSTTGPAPDESSKNFLSRIVVLRKLLHQLRDNNSEVLSLLEEHKKAIEQFRQKEARIQKTARNLITVGLAANFVLALLLLFLFINNISSRLAVLIDNASRLPKRLPLNSTVSGGDELSFLDDAMHSASHELVQAWNHREALVGMVAHDLRSPLNSCQISLEILREYETEHISKDGIEQLNNVSSNIRRLLALINDLLTIDKLEAGELKLDRQNVELSALAEEAIESLRTLATSKSITIENECGGVMIFADRERIVQVLINYLANAIKFSPSRSKIAITTSDKVSNLITVSVEDEGPGLTQAEIKRVFEKFYQAKSDASVKGFGLGLAICKLIIESHGGQSGVESTKGQGCRFWFRIATPQ